MSESFSWWLLSGEFLISSFLQLLLVPFECKKIFPFTLFIRSFIRSFFHPFVHLYLCGLVDSYYIQWIIIGHFIISLDAQIIPDLTSGNRSGYRMCPFDRSSSFLKPFFTFWPKKMFQAFLALPLPQPGNQPFLRKALVLFSEKRHLETKILMLSVVIAIRMLLFLVPLRVRQR